jgi:hypothetical protein
MATGTEFALCEKRVVGQFHVNSSRMMQLIDRTFNVNSKLTHYRKTPSCEIRIDANLYLHIFLYRLPE